MSFALEFRPKVFSDVLGQQDAVATLKAQLRQALPMPLLLSGEPGTGKTTLSQVVARALNCTAPAADGSPCLSCECCEAFDTDDRAHFYLEINVPQFIARTAAVAKAGGKLSDLAASILEVARSPAFYGASRRVLFLDEAHALGGVFDKLLGALERGDGAAFVFATNQPERLPPAFRSRCLEIGLRHIPEAELITLGRRVCAVKKVNYDPSALAMLAAASQGRARDFLMNLDEVAARGPVTISAVGTTLDLAWAPLVLGAVADLLRGRYAGAQTALTGWRALPGTKARALRDGLLFVTRLHFAPPRGADEPVDESALAAFVGVPSADVVDVAAAVAQRAAVLGVPAGVCVVEWALFWSACAPAVLDEVDFELRLRAFALHVCPPGVELPPLPAPVAPPLIIAPRRRAVVRAAVRSADGVKQQQDDALTRADVFAQYRAATLLPQAYGLWFNTLVVSRWREFDVEGWPAVRTQFSALTHEMGMRLRDWVGDAAFRLHWLAQHEVDAGGGFVTWLLLCVPPGLSARAREWTAEFLPVPVGRLANELGDDVWWSPAGSLATAHWRLVRVLWRALDGDLTLPDEAGVRRPLKALLGVPVQGPRVAGVLSEGARRWSSSQTLGPGVWRAAVKERFAFVSVLDEPRWSRVRPWHALDTGWEAFEYECRVAETARRAARLSEIEAALPAGVCAAQDAAREERLRALRESWPLDPMKRPRSRCLW